MFFQLSGNYILANAKTKRKRKQINRIYKQQKENYLSFWLYFRN